MRKKPLDRVTFRELAMAWFAALSLMPWVIAPASAETATRSEVPIREVVLSDGARRYSVPIIVGGKTLVAGFDTGSTGLRILPGVLGEGDARSGSTGDRYAYGSSVALEGVVAEATVTLGGLSASLKFQRVGRVFCIESMPHCPASRLPASRYGLQGDGLPNEGFPAILGVNMSDAEVARPLPALGAARWIVELPRPGEAVPGRLILNPDDSEARDFTVLAAAPSFRAMRGGIHDAVTGCLTNLGSHAKACGALMLDTGAPGIMVQNGGLGHVAWPNGTPSLLSFDGADGKTGLAERFQIGQRAQASRLGFEESPDGEGTLIFSGLTAYFAFSVLYDPAHETVALKPRPQAPAGPEIVRMDAGP